MKGRAHPTETFKTFLRPPLRVFHFQRCAPQAPRRNPVVVVVYDGRGRWGVVTVGGGGSWIGVVRCGADVMT